MNSFGISGLLYGETSFLLNWPVCVEYGGYEELHLPKL